MLKMLRKIISGGQTGADRAGLDFAIETGLEQDMFAGAVRQKTVEWMPGTTWLSSQPARIRREPRRTSRNEPHIATRPFQAAGPVIGLRNSKTASRRSRS